VKKRDLRRDRKTSVEDAKVTCWSKLFQIRATATGKIRLLPNRKPVTGVGDGGQEGHVPPPPPKIREEIVSGNFYVKFWHFSGKNHVKLGNFVKF